ncbi:type II toxin-antitoxin system prevent-host-death family antitoxin [Roseomonas sp. PWR1]|uniref:Antitoxin n=1 Tax=Roseomonas nitratireducens TaxID=2820810 RepID=A0ABS4AZU4_9PROT|nr:type II toxin-antitoxin system prevent-host-death family antitoxin [Neoroseomonas nitratireducens]MBP0466898.1 type II toxin-antitoxin system prevent-host-death family antitoxin [Neoroseomonas nitratireducens]
MSHVSYTDLRNNLARYMDTAIETRDAILVTRQGGKGNVVLISEEEFRGWQETVHLMASPANAARLMRSLAAAEEGRTTERALLVPPAGTPD